MQSHITINDLTTNDFEAIECIRAARGDNYYSRKYYDLDYLVNSGEHKLFAARTERGEPIAIAGLSGGVIKGSSPTLTLLNVKPCHTGGGVATALMRHCIDFAENSECKAIKGQVVTRHIKLQRMLEGFKFQPTGFLLGIRNGRNATPHIEGKCPLTMHVRNFNAKDAGRLYLPLNLTDYTLGVYNNLNVKAEIINDGTFTAGCEIDDKYDAHDDVLFIYVRECGADIADKLDAITQRYLQSPTASVILYLNLRSPSAVAGYTVMEASGWRFCGLNPLDSSEEAIFYKGCMYMAKMEMTERTGMIYEKLNLR